MHGAGTPRNKDQNQLIKALRYHSVEYILGRRVSCYPKGLRGLNGRTEIIFGNDKATSKRDKRVRRVGKPATASHGGNTELCPS